MKLYEFTNDFAQVFERFDAINSWEPDTDTDGNPIDYDGNIIKDVARYKENMLTAWFDTLDGIEQEFEAKAENIAVYIKCLLAEAKQLKAEEQSLKTRRQSKEKQAERLKEYLLNNMQKIERRKIDKPKAVISVRNNAESVVVSDEDKLIALLIENDNNSMLRFYKPELNKAEIKKVLKSGCNIPFASLERTQSLIIK